MNSQCETYNGVSLDVDLCYLLSGTALYSIYVNVLGYADISCQVNTVHLETLTLCHVNS